ncbi:MAG: hypothetical protein ACREXS_04610 [Gammaproteobacteria bacterium]
MKRVTKPAAEVAAVPAVLDLVATQPLTLRGRRFDIGETVPLAVWAEVPEKNRIVLLDSRRVQPRAEFKPSDEEVATVRALEATRERLASAEQSRDRIAQKVSWTAEEIQRRYTEIGPLRLDQEDQACRYARDAFRPS